MALIIHCFTFNNRRSAINTFLPSGDFNICAQSLDPLRLSRQITEVPTIARTLWVYQVIMDTNQRKLPWGCMFPSVINLWVTEGGIVLLPELRQYHMALHREWKNTGHPPHKSFTQLNWDSLFSEVHKDIPHAVVWPADVHDSHRSKLYGKDASYYRRVFDRLGLPEPKPGLRYVWGNPERVLVSCS